MTAAFAAYQAQYVPSGAAGDGNSTFIEAALHDQRSFWEAVQFKKMKSFRGVTFEVRYVSHERSRKIDLWLIADLNELGAEERAAFAKDIEAILPRGYGWICYNALTEADLPIPDRASEGGWVTSRAVRRLVFADVPEARDLDVAATDGPDAPSPLAPADPTDDAKRSVVGFNDIPARDPAPTGGGWAIPLIVSIQATGQLSASFFEQLQLLSPAVISIRFARLGPERLPPLRSMATRYLQLSLGPLSSSIETAYGAESASYQRYLLPDDLFNVVDISFASSSLQNTENLCNLFCAQLGSLAGFEQARIRESSTLAEFNTKISVRDFFENRIVTAMRRECLADDIDIFGVEIQPDDDIINNFLLDAPYIYTFHETLAIIGLPTADERGLPGLDSRLLPPFNSPTLSYDPVHGRAEPAETSAPCASTAGDGLRIGTRGKVRIGPDGDILEAGDNGARGANWHRIDESDLTKHALIVGSTGSGKTMVTSFVVRELARKNIPFCVIEPVKTEYFRRLSKIMPVRRFNFEGDGNRRSREFFSFDPFRLPATVSVARHAAYVGAAWQAAFPMDALGALLFANGLLRYYTDDGPHACGLHLFQRGDASSFRYAESDDGGRLAIFPSFWTFRAFFLEHYIPKAWETVTGGAQSNENRENAITWFRRRFDLIEGGLLGQALLGGQARAERAIRAGTKEPLKDDLDRLFDGNVVLELDAIPDSDEKALVMAFVMSRLFELRQAESQVPEADSQTEAPGAEPVRQGRLKHVLVVEEAHRLLSATAAHATRGENGGADPKAKAIGLFVDMLAEIRALGQGLIVVEQIPTKIIPEAIKNTNLKIMLRLPSREDREVLGQAMGLTEEQVKYVATLRATPESGIDFVAFEEQLDQPILLNLPLPGRGSNRTDPDWLFDQFFAG